MEVPQIFGLAFLGVCGLGTLGYLERIAKRWAVLCRAVAVDGTIVRIEEDYDSEHGYSLFRPVARYVTEGGAVEELGVTKPFSKGRWAVGDAFPILYDPTNPKFAVWANGRWSGGMIGGLLMCLFGTAVGAGLYFFCKPPYVQ